MGGQVHGNYQGASRRGVAVMNQSWEHPDSEVREALIRLVDALCEWERNTGRSSTLILIEDTFQFRAVDGKPNIPDFVSDIELIQKAHHMR